ncbi:hypothetical protein BofuT4_P101440.1 [Botrytis cinerea T4]|uniref:Uncharacterized protein n=1 Tax=Botryotinia fuckeliana (strain T4) TaxID=999810 RepID=G2YBZ9_BOTF4|nr:hypothetical protein BofuT4_P101440.1 [Botrytis cinerea T4]
MARQSEWFSTLSMHEFNRYCDVELKTNPDLGRLVPWEIEESRNIPIVERAMGFEKEIARVQKRIKEYKKGILSSRAKMAGNVDLEKVF